VRGIEVKYIQLIYDPKEETREAFETRMAEAVAAAGEQEENVTVIVREIIDWNPTVDDIGHA
jgi:hypothetical protein